jgi:hypothetical protein
MTHHLPRQPTPPCHHGSGDLGFTNEIQMRTALIRHVGQRMSFGIVTCTVAFMVTLPGLAQASYARPANAASGSTIRAVDHATGLTTTSGSRDVTTPRRAGQGVRIAGAGLGADLTITPELHGTSAARTTGDTTVLADSATGLNVAIQPLRHAMRMMSVLANRAAPTTTAYRVSLPAGARLQKDELGGVMLVKNGVMIGRFAAPWAVDASNRSLPTTYTVAGNTITQTVNTSGARFPVVADPHYTWGNITGTVYFNKSETAKIAASAAFVAALGAFAPPPFNIILVASAATISWEATWAMADGKCVKVKSTGAIGEYGGSSGDGYCR